MESNEVWTRGYVALEGCGEKGRARAQIIFHDVTEGAGPDSAP